MCMVSKFKDTLHYDPLHSMIAASLEISDKPFIFIWFHSTESAEDFCYGEPSRQGRVEF